VGANFVEIFNRGSDSISLAEWSVQYQTYVSPDWGVIPLAGRIGPGRYYLVQVDGGSDLNPDARGTFANVTPLKVPMAAEGSIGLVPRTTALGLWPSILEVADLFGYGPGQAADGSAFALLYFGGKAALRMGNGCISTHNNAADFQLGSAAPRNTASAATRCSPVIQLNGVVNSASLAPGPIAPGELLTIFGSNLGPSGGAGVQLTADGTHVATSLAGVRVLFDGIAAPMLYASDRQLNIVAPFELAQRKNTSIQVEVNGVVSDSQSAAVAASAPALFTYFGTGAGRAVALNEDGSTNSDLLASVPGGILVLYGTGAGQTVAPGENGRITGSDLPKPVLPVSVSIGGRTAQVLYAGNAPGLVSGVLQVNVRVPDSLSGRQPVILTVGGVQSQAEVNVAVQIQAAVPSSLLFIDAHDPVDLAYDSGSHRLYASIGPNGGASANSILIVDPSGGQIVDSIKTQGIPGRIAVSDDGHYLYIAVVTTPPLPSQSLERIDLRTRNVDFVIPVKDILPEFFDPLGTMLISDLQALPGQPASVAVAATTGTSSRDPFPLAILDGKVRRPVLGPATKLLGEGPPGQLWTDQRGILTGPDGARAGLLYPRLVDINSFFGVISAGDRLVASNGLVFSADGSELIGQMPVLGADSTRKAFAYRSDTGLAYYASMSDDPSITIEAFDLKILSPAGVFQAKDPDVRLAFSGPPVRLVPVGLAGLATIAMGSSRIFILPLSAIQPLAPITLPPPNSASSTVRRFPIPNSAVGASPGGEKLYLSLPSAAIGAANSVIPFDVGSGQFGNPLWVGSEPRLLAVSTDGQYLHAALDGARTIVRFTLPDLKFDKQFHVLADDGRLLDTNILLSLPANPKSVGVGRVMAFLSHSYGVAIYDDGVRRPRMTTPYGSREFFDKPIVNEGQLSADGQYLYGVAGEVEGSRLSRWLVTPQGLEFDAAGTTFGFGIYLDLRCQRNLCVTGSGYLADANTLGLIGQLQALDSEALAIMDLDANRIFLLSSGYTSARVDCFDATTYRRTGSYTFYPSDWNSPAHTFIKVAGDQLAIGTYTQLVLLPISAMTTQ
jgi:uncharacterized protein (TIGR03437 family)